MRPNGYDALRSAAAWRVTADRGWIAVGGADRARFLQGLLTNDIVALAPGTGCYAAYLTPQGRIIADMHLLAETDRVVVDLHRSVKDRLLERWDDLIFTEDVTLTDLTPNTAAVDLCGPGAHSILARIAGARGDPATLGLYRHRAGAVASHAVRVARIDDLGIEGYRLLIPPRRRRCAAQRALGYRRRRSGTTPPAKRFASSRAAPRSRSTWTVRQSRSKRALPTGRSTSTRVATSARR